MATSTPLIRIVLATDPTGNQLFRSLLESQKHGEARPRFEIHGLSERSHPISPEPDGWRKQMFEDVAACDPHVVILSPAHAAETIGTCLALLDMRPNLLVLAVPIGEKGETLAVAYRKAPFVEEVSIDHLLPFILATCREDGAPSGGDLR